MSVNGNTQLALLSTARQALAEAKTIDEVKHVRDKAEAIRQYAKAQGECLEIQNHAAEVKIRAERKAGELLAAMEKHNGDPMLHDATRLSDLGVERTQSHRWQRMASLPEPMFEQHVSDTVTGKRELTSAGVLSLAKSLKNERRNDETISEAKSEESIDAIAASGEKFGCIYADPPWRYGNQATRAATDNHYPTMTPDDIAALPIASLAADNAHLHLWTTNAFLFDCQRIIEAWGFTYKSCFVWVKPQMGIGNYWRVSHEFMLLGVRGECPFLDRGQMSWMQIERTGHSCKPEKVRKAIELVSPGPRLELFGRRLADGWTVWGNQISRTMFDAEKVG